MKTFLTRVIFVIFTVDIGVREFMHSPSTVTAFSSSPISSRSSAKKLFSSLKNANADENLEHQLLLDESVMLYNQLRKENENDDVQTKRKIELTSLIEDVVLDESGLLRDEVTDTMKDAPKNEETTNEEPSDLDEIRKALDEQILLGSEKTFSEEELKEWIERIDSLRDQLQSQLTALPPVSSPTTTNTATSDSGKPPKAIDRLRRRLESMRTSIEPAGGTQ